MQSLSRILSCNAAQVKAHPASRLRGRMFDHEFDELALTPGQALNDAGGCIKRDDLDDGAPELALPDVMQDLQRVLAATKVLNPDHARQVPCHPDFDIVGVIERCHGCGDIGGFIRYDGKAVV